MFGARIYSQLRCEMTLPITSKYNTGINQLQQFLQVLICVSEHDRCIPQSSLDYLFPFFCRDRKKIKARIESKRRLRLEQSAYENPENGIVQNGLEEDETVVSSKRVKDSDATTASSDSNHHSQVFRTVSADDFVIIEQEKYLNHVDNSIVPNTTLSSSVPDLQHIRSLSPDCLAVKKQIRRTSYAIAVDNFSWLPKDQPKFAKTKKIIETYNIRPGTTRSYENRAFDPQDMSQVNVLSPGTALQPCNTIVIS